METWHTNKDVMKRKAEVENGQHGQQSGVFCAPSNQTIEDFMYDFVTMYGESQWGVSTYDGNTGLIANYVNPIIGQLQIQEFNARAANKYIQVLRKTPPVSTKWRKPKGEVITNQTISSIVKLL